MSRVSKRPRGGKSLEAISAEVLHKLLIDAAWTNDTSGLDPAAMVEDLLQQFAPQDAAERLLVHQMIATHTRVLFLARHANGQKNARWFSLFQGELTKTLHLYRAQMQTLADTRRPRRHTFTAIRTANIAAQQVVQTPPALPAKRRRPAKSLPGAAHALPTAASQATTPNAELPTSNAERSDTSQAEVPPLPDRPSRPDRRDPEDPALEDQHRPPHPHRQNDVEPQ